MASTNPFKKIFDLYTSDLSFQEIERLIKRDSADVYEFFKNDIPKDEKSKNKFVRALIFLRSIFNAFLLRLSPARRIFYLAALLIFIFGYLNDIGSYVILSFLLLNVLLAFELADKLLTKDELSIARKIQSGLMPKIPPELKDYEISAYYQAANEVGGDYYDIITPKDSENRTYLFVGDISGKGMAAALYMVRVQAIIHTLIQKYRDIKKLLINLKLQFDENLLPEYFLTLAVASINNDKSVELSSAGHQPILFYKSSSKEIEEINPKGIGIGLRDKGKFGDMLETVTIRPSEGDILFFFTDGLTEAMNTDKSQFGINLLKKIIQENASLSCRDLKVKILEKLEIFCENEPANDDLSMIILKAK